MTKQLSMKNVPGVRGGSGHMLGKKGSGTMKAGDRVNTGGGGGGKGGKGHMVGKTGSRPAKAGKTSNY